MNHTHHICAVLLLSETNGAGPTILASKILVDTSRIEMRKVCGLSLCRENKNLSLFDIKTKDTQIIISNQHGIILKDNGMILVS